MKIIGNGTGELLICEVTKDEIAKLHGLYSGYQLTNEKGNGAFNPGSCLDVSEMYRRSKETIEAYSELRKSLSALKGHSEKLLANMAQEVEKIQSKEK